MTTRLGKLGKGWIAAGMVLGLGACTPMTGHDPTARTSPPGGDRFANAWCEAETREGGLVSCGSPRLGAVHYGEFCQCPDPDRSAVLVGRVVAPPKVETVSAASPAYTDAD